jgi:hypothetical protein
MSGLLEAYVRADPGKAVALAEGLASEMTSPSDKKTWGDFAAYARAVVDAQASIDAGRGAEAIARRQGAAPTLYQHHGARSPEGGRQDANGATAAAYDSLLVIASKTPTDAVNAAIALRRKLGKSAGQSTSTSGRSSTRTPSRPLISRCPIIRAAGPSASLTIAARSCS